MSEELSGRSEEQGSALPPVPEFTIKCEKCNHELALEDGKIPHVCSNCGYHIRPETDSVWSHFGFVFRYRYLTWRGRATRKEFWSFELISHSLWILLLVVSIYIADYFYNKGCMSMLVPLLCVSFSSIVVYIFFIGIPQIFIIARRLHDISMSAVAVVVHLSLFFAMIVTMLTCIVMLPTDLRSDADIENQLDPEMVDFQLDDAIVVRDSDISEKEPKNKVFPLILLSTIMNMGLEGLNFFFFIISFIDSSHGTNRFGPSRKYPIAL